MVSGGCQGNGTLTLSVEPANVQVKADLTWLQEIAGFFECLGTLQDFGCVEGRVEEDMRAGLRFPSINQQTIDAGSICTGTSYPWVVQGGTVTTGAAIIPQLY